MKPKIICYCGSLRVALEAFKEAEYKAVLNGEIALLPCCMFVDIQREYGAESYKTKADDLHKRKIDICDEVFVLNVGGYIGDSTRSEIEYAIHIGKPIKYLEEKALDKFQIISLQQLATQGEKENDQIGGDWLNANKDKWKYLKDLRAIDEWDSGVWYVTKLGEVLLKRVSGLAVIQTP